MKIPKATLGVYGILDKGENEKRERMASKGVEQEQAHMAGKLLLGNSETRDTGGI